MSNRTYSQALNDGKGAANFPYIFDPAYVTTGAGGQLISGNWRPATTADVSISNSNISMSGVTLQIGAVAITGVAQVAGNVGITNTAPLNVTGIILTQVTGSISSTISSVAITGSPQITINGGYVGITGSLSGQLSLGTGDFISIANPVLATSGISTILSLPSHNVNITGNPVVTITGVIATNTSITVGAIAITGFDSKISPLAVSGNFVSTPGNTAVTGGFINVSNTAPLPISGVVQAQVTIGSLAITGFDSKIAPLAVSGNFGSVPQNTVITGFNSTIAPLAVTGFIRTITTGTFSATVDNTTLILAVASGNAYNAAISGLLSSNLTDPAYVTGAVSITNTSPVPISGIVQAQVTIGNIAVTGGSIATIGTGNRSVSIVNTAPIAISGIVQASVSIGNVAVTGGSILTIVTGSVSSTITNPIGVTGTVKDNNIVYNNGTIYNILPVGGRAVAATGAGAPTGYLSGAYAMLNINQSNGGLFVNQGVLDYTADNVTAIISGGYVGITGGNITVLNPIIAISGTVGLSSQNITITGFNSTIAPQAISGIVTLTSIPSQNVTITGGVSITGFSTGVIISTQPVTATTASNYTVTGIVPFSSTAGFVGTALYANPNRVMMFVQNVHSGIPLYVVLGTGAATATNFSMILNPSSNQGWGGDSFSDDHYRGKVMVSGGAWIAWEL